MLERLRESLENAPISAGTGRDRLEAAFLFVCFLGSTGLMFQGVLADQLETTLAAGFFAAVVASSYLLSRKGYTLLPRCLILVTALVMVTAVAIQGQGIHDVGIAFFPVVVIFAGLLLGVAGTLIFAVLGSIAALFLVWADSLGWTDSPLAALSDPPDALALGIILAMSAGLVSLVISNLNRTLLSLRANEIELAESNLGLERRAEELRASEARWRSLVENAPDRILTIGPDGTILFSSLPTSEEIEGPIPVSIYELIDEADHATFRTAVEAVFTEAAPASCELRSAEAGRWWSIRMGPIEAPGSVRGAILVLSDASTRRDMEIRLREAQKMEALGQLAGGIAHDFNNLLTVIGGNASLLEPDVPEGEARESLGEIHSAQERASTLVRQLLAFGRRQVMRPRVLDLRESLASLESMLRRLLGEDVDVEISADPEAGPVLADPGQIEQVIVNLVLNARDAMSGGGRLELRLWSHESTQAERIGGTEIAPGRHTVVSFVDNGIGMDPATLERIFEPFFSTKADEKGSGLGLASVYGIVSQNRGQIAVESQPGRGTTFHIYLPTSERSPEVGDESQGSGPVATGSEHILVVEDDDAMRRLLGRVLNERGFGVTLASNGAEALDEAANGATVDLILTDLIMPGMNGKDFADRYQQRFGPVAVLFMSGYADDTLGPRGVLDQPVNFIQKPFSQGELAERLRKALDERR